MAQSIIRELCQLQNPTYVTGLSYYSKGIVLTIDRVFMSRTVAAEILLECLENTEAYETLITLGREGLLTFNLSYAHLLTSMHDSDPRSTVISW